MITENEAINLVHSQLIEEDISLKEIADICPENFGWIFLLQYIKPPKEKG